MNRAERWAITQILGRPPRRVPMRRHARWPHVDASYKAWVRTLRCCGCGLNPAGEAAHAGTDGGMKRKASDRSCVPLCVACHRTGPHAYHGLNGGKREFERRHMIDFAAIVERLNAQYAARGGRA